MLYFHALLTLLLAAWSLSCPPLLNDIRLLGNSTHSSFQLIEAARLERRLPWAKLVTPDGPGNLAKLWSRNEQGIALVNMDKARVSSSTLLS
jgi:hypothetical protein